MRRTAYAIMAAIAFSSGSWAHATSGNDYRKLPEAQRLAWTVGVADGILTAQLMASNKTPPLAECLGKLEREQIRAIFEKSLEKQPERWQFPAAFIFHTTFNEYCGIK